ncbi:MAG: hypothetical protein ABI378_09045 [Chitinophagaceae bacterium]
MKQIGASTPNEQFNKEILGQLSFIKKHLRYPISRRMTLLALPFLTVIPALLYFLLIAPNSNYKAQILIPVLLGLLLVVALRRTYQSLHFLSIPAHRLFSENIVLLQQFLTENHFAFGRHPEAPEVFMIMSKNIGRQKEEREIVVFIADDHRILINSHFFQRKFRTPIEKLHHKQIAAELKNWLKTRLGKGETSTALSRS